MDPSSSDDLKALGELVAAAKERAIEYWDAKLNEEDGSFEATFGDPTKTPCTSDSVCEACLLMNQLCDACLESFEESNREYSLTFEIVSLSASSCRNCGRLLRRE